jgi:hypothetical protein
LNRPRGLALLGSPVEPPAQPQSDYVAKERGQLLRRVGFWESSSALRNISRNL